MARCFDCNLPDPYNGAGDGVGSCMCPRCEWCEWAPGMCTCSDDEFFDDYCTEMERPPPVVDVADTRGLL